MSLSPQSVQGILAEHQKHSKDTGSPEVQIALLTEKIRSLTEHLKKHRHDFNSRRGMQRMVSQRKKFLRYLKRSNIDSFQKIVSQLGIRANQV